MAEQEMIVKYIRNDDDTFTMKFMREVVRCKNCKHSDWYTAVDGNRYCFCMIHGSSGHDANSYCSYGEKDGKDNDGNDGV